MIKKLEIGLRLKEFAKKKFGGIAGLERILEKSPGFFQNYINGRSYLGGELLIELYNVGCDINWLLNGSPAATSSVKDETNTAADYKFNVLEERITKLESKLFQLTEENERLSEENNLLKHNLDKDINDIKIKRNH